MTTPHPYPHTGQSMLELQLTPSVALLGLGNLLRSDDGVGVHAIRSLQQSGRLPPDVHVIEGGTLGLDLLPAVQGITHLLVLDAVETGSQPGALSRFAGANLQRLPVAKSVHLLGFADLLNSLSLLDQLPVEVVLLGVEPESTGWGLILSPPVAAVLDELAEAALAQLAAWTGYPYERRDASRRRLRSKPVKAGKPVPLLEVARLEGG